MTWSTDDGKHEGWAACVAPDGRLSFASNATGQLVHGVTGRYQEDHLTHDAEFVPDDEIRSWRAACTCGWVGPLWSRVLSADLEDRPRRQFFVPLGDFADAPEALEDAIGDQWRDHATPVMAAAAVEAAARAYAAAGKDLTRAVAAARAHDVPWSEIGRAAGMSKQAAHERWGTNLG